MTGMDEDPGARRPQSWWGRILMLAILSAIMVYAATHLDSPLVRIFLR